MKYLTNLDLNKNELQNVIIHPLSTPPNSPKIGQIYFNSVDKDIYEFDGEIWKKIGFNDSGDIKENENFKCYNSLIEVKNDINLKLDYTVITLGYYESNDGGNGFYKIRSKEVSDIEDNGSIVFLKNNLVAELIINNETVNIKQFGAKCDFKTDDSPYIIKAIEFCNKNNIKLEIDSAYIKTTVDFSQIKNLNIKNEIQGDIGTFVIIGNSDSPLNIFINKITNTSLKVVNVANCNLKVNYANELILQADNTKFVAYSSFYLGKIKNLIVTSNGDGWVNENKFYGGRLKNVTFTGEYNHNHNIFISPMLENVNFKFDVGSCNRFYNCRLEGTNTFVFSSRASNNILFRTWFDLLYLKNQTSDTILNITDNNGSNTIVNENEINTKKYKYEVTSTSNNFNTDWFIKSNDELKVLTKDKYLYETNLIDITKQIGISTTCDKKIFRFELILYDENKNQIITEPTHRCYKHTTLTWSDSKQGYIINNYIDDIKFVIGRFIDGIDSNVKYVKFKVRLGGVEVGYNINYIKTEIVCDLNNNTFINFNGYNSLVGTKHPTEGTWDNGDIIININAKKQNYGWIYQDNWKEIPLSNNNTTTEIKKFKYGINSESNNFNTDWFVKNEGLLKVLSKDKYLYETNLMDVTKEINLNTVCDQKIFRFELILYDENKTQIITEPIYRCYKGTTLEWSNKKQGYVISNYIDHINFEVGRFINGVDSKVQYVKFKIRLGGVTEGYNINYINTTISCNNDNNLFVTFKGNNSMVGTYQPIDGIWNNGDIIINIGETSQNVGWVYRNGWKQI